MSDTQETSTQSANANMRRFIQSIRVICLEIAIVGLFAIAAFYYVPSFVNSDTVTVYQVTMPIIGLLVGLLLSWLFYFLRAPHLQRNESRNELRKKPIPIPLPNRTEFIKAMTETVKSAYNCLQLKYFAATLRESKHPSAHGVWEESEQAGEHYRQARDKLGSGALVEAGGKRFEGISLEVHKLISLLDRDVSKFYGDKRPDMDIAARKSEYNIALDEVIKRIDEIYQSIPDKG